MKRRIGFNSFDIYYALAWFFLASVIVYEFIAHRFRFKNISLSTPVGYGIPYFYNLCFGNESNSTISSTQCFVIWITELNQDEGTRNKNTDRVLHNHNWACLRIERFRKQISRVCCQQREKAVPSSLIKSRFIRLMLRFCYNASINSHSRSFLFRIKRR